MAPQHRPGGVARRALARSLWPMGRRGQDGSAVRAGRNFCETPLSEGAPADFASLTFYSP